MSVRVLAPGFRLDIRIVDLVERDRKKSGETTSQWYEDAVLEKLRTRQPGKLEKIEEAEIRSARS